MKYHAQGDGMLDLVPRSGLAKAVASGLISTLDHIVEAPVAWLERMRERQQLAGLSDAMLKDIGVSRADVEHVVEKPFWRA